MDAKGNCIIHLDGREVRIDMNISSISLLLFLKAFHNRKTKRKNVQLNSNIVEYYFDKCLSTMLSQLIKTVRNEP